ncbi:MAG: hypothetical protein Q7S50_03430 [bacterium]|nr:hypothetical protein [bacterium]
MSTGDSFGNDSKRPKRPDERSGLSRRAALLLGASALPAAITGPDQTVQTAGMAEEVAKFTKFAMKLPRTMQSFNHFLKTFQPKSEMGLQAVAKVFSAVRGEIPLDSSGKVDLGILSELHHALSFADGHLKDPWDLLLDSNNFAQAARIAGIKETNEEIIQAIDILKQIAGAPASSSLLDTSKILSNHIAILLENILDHPEIIPGRPERDESGGESTICDFYNHISNMSIHLLDADPNRAKSIRERANYYFEAAYPEMKNRERQSNKDTVASRLEPPKRDLSAEGIDARPFLLCSVDFAERSPDSNARGKTFLISIHGDTGGLTRMHVQHLRQLLTHQSILDNFDEKNTVVDVVGRNVRVTSSDDEFSEYLTRYARSGSRLYVPNRLQSDTKIPNKPPIYSKPQRWAKGE